MTLEDTFEYSALDATREEIRLLNLYPGNHRDPIILNFQVLQLEDKTELDLEAVSYKWGRPEGCHQLRIDGNAFFVSSSQNQMILDLRFPRKTRRLWIDALCINQRDVTERSSQVQLMRKIYSLARGVCIWLDHEIGWEDPSCQKLLTFNSGCETKQLLEESESFWDPVCNFLKSDYFDRLWVQQEISNARTISVQCRETPIPVACIIHFLNAWNTIGYENAMNIIELNRQDSISYAAPSRFAMLLAKRNTLGSTKKTTLLEILCSATELKVTDARDIIYGLMFLAYNWQENDLIADYSMTMSEVFRGSMISYLKVYNSVAFLEHANLLSHAPESLHNGHPSWVPDWTKPCHSAHSTASIEIRRKEESPLIAHVSGNYLYTTGVKISVVYQVYRDLLHSDVGSISGRQFFEELRRITREAKFPQDLRSKTRHLTYLLTRQTFADDPPLDEDRFAEVGDDFQCLSDRFLSPRDGDVFSEPSLTLDGTRHLVRIFGTHQQDD